jgi:hypothetical protein
VGTCSSHTCKGEIKGNTTEVGRVKGENNETREEIKEEITQENKEDDKKGWKKKNNVLYWTVGISTIPGGHLTFCTEDNVRFPRSAADQAILPVQVVGIALQINHLTVQPAHVSVFGTENFGVLELAVTTAVEPMFSHYQFIGLSELNVPVLLLHTGLISLSNIHPAMLKGRVVHIQHLHSPGPPFTVCGKLAIFLRGRPTLLMCLASILL